MNNNTQIDNDQDDLLTQNTKQLKKIEALTK